MKTVFFYITLSLLILSGNVFGQDFNRVFGEGKLLSVGGGINLNQVFYTSYGGEQRRDPYNYFLSGSLNLDFVGISVPLTFSYSNQNASFQQPFNQFSMQPVYKNFKGYAGYNSMSFSKYTLSGHVFYGGGLEVSNLGSFEISTMYGRLRKAVEYDSLNSQNAPSFARYGGGLKVSYRGKNGSFSDLIVFSSEDNENSIEFTDSLGITPENNLAIGLLMGRSITKNLSIKVEYGGSSITKNTTLLEPLENKTTIVDFFGLLHDTNASSEFYNAINASLNYSGTFYSMGLNYERVDPGYTTHGAYYFNNDLENITTNFAVSMLKSKVTLAANVGLQRNNLNGEELSEFERWVGSVNLAYSPKPGLSLSGSYSNFQSYTNIRPAFETINDLTPYDNLDTLNFRQISQNANFNANYVIKQTKELRQNLNLNLSYQTSNDEQGDVEQSTSSNFYNLNTAYSYSLLPSSFTITAAVNANFNEASSIKNRGVSPNLSLSKSFLKKKLRTNISTTYTYSKASGAQANKIFNFRIGGSYRFFKKHNVNLNIVTLRRGKTQAVSSITESTGTLSYNYNF